jgi:hypothetical protein
MRLRLAQSSGDKAAVKSSACLTVLLALVFTAGVTAQQKHSGSWMELSRKDAEKLVSDSPWAQTQVDTDASEMFYSPTRPGTASVGRSNTGNVTSQQSINNNRADRGAVNEAVSVKYRICFLSAKPIRRAFAKMILSAQDHADSNLAERLQSFVERDFSPYIVIAVSVDSSDGRFSGPIMQAFNSANTGALKNSAYLERQDGKRLFLISYLAPIEDGLGAKFIFPRSENGEFFLNVKSDSVRFVADFTGAIKLNKRFKVSDMVFDDKLEY